MDIEKEREAFSQSHRLKENGIAYFENVGSFAYERKEREKIEMDYEFLILIRKLWLAWIQCAESKQSEIDRLKAQIKAESETCKWYENEDGIWNTACGQDYIFDSYAGQKPSDSGQYCSNCGKKFEDVSFEETE